MSCFSAQPSLLALLVFFSLLFGSVLSSEYSSTILLILSRIPRKNSLDSLTPSAFNSSLSVEIKEEWNRATMDMLTHESCTELSSADYPLLSKSYTRTTLEGGAFCVLMRTDAPLDPGVLGDHGSLLVKTSRERERTTTDLHFQVTHPVTDGKIMEQAAHLLYHVPTARSLLVSGTTRDANTLIVNDCQSQYFLLDAAHQTHLLFQHTAQKTVELYAKSGPFSDRQFVVLQLHGMAETSCPGVGAYVSSSATQGILPSAVAHPIRLVRTLNSFAPHWNVTYVGDSNPEATCNLKGTTNTQGRALNRCLVDQQGLIDTCEWKTVDEQELCDVFVPSSSGLFIHVEQKKAIREDLETWAQALGLLFSS